MRWVSSPETEMNDHIMDRNELRRTLAALWWTPTALGGALDCTPRTVNRWLDGSYTVPTPIAVWLRDLVSLHAAHPAPGSWRGQSVAVERAVRYCAHCGHPPDDHPFRHPFV
jgi:hypothetical protein